MVGVARKAAEAEPPIKDAQELEEAYPLGAWSNGAFAFQSPAAEQQWRRDAVNAGVHFQNWNQGRKLNEKTRQLVELGFAPSADIYHGPDGDYYHMTPAVAPIAGAISETVPANDNETAANDNAHDPGPVVGTIPDSPDGKAPPPAPKRPGLGRRFGAAFEKGAMDGTILGELAQELKKGTGYDPDTLATHIPERFMQSPASQQAWRDMYATLGIAGGKRGIDLVAPEERKLYETDWERLTPEQQTAYREMSDAAKARYASWKRGL